MEFQGVLGQLRHRLCVLGCSVDGTCHFLHVIKIFEVLFQSEPGVSLRFFHHRMVKLCPLFECPMLSCRRSGVRLRQRVRGAASDREIGRPEPGPTTVLHLQSS